MEVGGVLLIEMLFNFFFFSKLEGIYDASIS